MDKIKQLFMMKKNTQQTGNILELPQYNKGPLWKSTANMIFNSERQDDFPLRSGKQTRMFDLAMSIHHCTGDSRPGI